MNKALKLTLLTLALSIALLAAAGCHKQKITTGQVVATLDTLESRLAWLEYRLNEERWSDAVYGSSDSLGYFYGLRQYTLSNTTYFDALNTGRQLIGDKEQLRRYNLIFPDVLLSRVEHGSMVSRLRDSLMTVTNGGIRPGQGPYLTQKRSAIERERAYRMWAGESPQLADALQRLLRLRHQAARQAGYGSYLSVAFASRSMNLQDSRRLLENLNAQSSQAYTELLERRRLDLGRRDLYPWDMWAIEADADLHVDSFFPVDSQWTIARKTLDAIGFDVDKLPLYVQFLDPAEGRATVAVFPIVAGEDVRIVCRLKDGVDSFRKLIGGLGVALTIIGVRQDNPLYANAIDDAWLGGMKAILVRLTDLPDWLTEFAHVPPPMAKRYLEARNEALMTALRYKLASVTFQLDAYSNPQRDLGQVYWDIFRRITDLTPQDDLHPWVAEMTVSGPPLSALNNLLGDLIAAQTIDYLVQSYGDDFKSTRLKSFLEQNYFRFGARYDWQELLRRGTDRPLDGQSYLSLLQS